MNFRLIFLELVIFSPDGSGILCVPSLGRQRYSVQLDPAPENKKAKHYCLAFN
ncbi:MAG: hypothetical protein ABI576_04620 [Flavobacterium sp.]